MRVLKQIGTKWHRFYDGAMRAPIAVYSAVVLGRDLVVFSNQVLADPAQFARLNAAVAVAVLARVSFWLFVGSVAILPIFRLPPLAKSGDAVPRLAALVSACLPTLFLFLARPPADLLFNSVSVVLGIPATVISIVTVWMLGRSFSIMPEARRLVTGGPYALVRHPLYACEIANLVAAVLQYRSLAAAALAASSVALLVARARWEEKVLAAALPDYALYRSRTPFLFPSRPVRFLTMTFADPAAKRRAAAAVAAILALAAAILAMLSWNAR